MKINKGIVKNINRKILAGGLAFTLISSAGCSIIDSVKYKKDEQGYIVGIDGTVSYNTIKNGCIGHVTNEVTGQKYYTIIYEYGLAEYDIFTGQKMGLKYIYYKSCLGLSTYLNAINKIKDEYTEEELKEFVNEYASSMKKNKELVKE